MSDDRWPRGTCTRSVILKPRWWQFIRRLRWWRERRAWHGRKIIFDGREVTVLDWRKAHTMTGDKRDDGQA